MFVRIHIVFVAWTLKCGTVFKKKWTLLTLLKDKQFLASSKIEHGMASLVSPFDEKNWFAKYYFAWFWNLLWKCSRLNLFLGMLHRKEIDIAPQGFSVSKGRASVVDFLPGIAPNYVQLFIRNPATLHNWVAYLEPLRWSCWFAILAFLVIAPPIVAAISFCGRNSFNCKKFWQCNITKNQSYYRN